MGVDHKYYLIPKPNSFVPEASQVTSFLHEAEADGWLRPRYPGWITRKAEGRKTRRDSIKLENAASEIKSSWNEGIRIGWRLWRRDDDIPYDLEIHVSPPEYVYQTSETVGWFGDSVNCSQCGMQLDHDADSYLFGISSIHATCPRCGTLFDPSNLPATYTHGWTGEKSVLLGGTTYRFALVIDNVPPEEWVHFQVDPKFIELVKRVFGHDFYDVADIN
jgi:hypothetical protein